MMDVDDSTIYDALVADVTTAWAPGTIFDSQPRVPNEQSALPVAFINMLEVEMLEREGQAAVKEVLQAFDYEITYQNYLPGAGEIYATKRAKANALLALLTADYRYPPRATPQSGGWHRRVTRVSYSEPAEEGAAPLAYEVTIGFRVERISGA